MLYRNVTKETEKKMLVKYVIANGFSRQFEFNEYLYI